MYGKTDEQTRRDPFQDVTDRILEALEAGTKPWVKPWNPDQAMTARQQRAAAVQAEASGQTTEKHQPQLTQQQGPKISLPGAVEVRKRVFDQGKSSSRASTAVWIDGDTRKPNWLGKSMYTGRRKSVSTSSRALQKVG